MPQDKDKNQKKARKVLENQGSVPLAHLEATMDMTEKLEEVKGVLMENHEKMMDKPEVQKVQIIPPFESVGEEDVTFAAQFASLMRGKKGDKPIKGKDYFTEEEISEFIEKTTPIKGKHYFDGKDGRNAITVSNEAPSNPIKGDLWYKN